MKAAAQPACSTAIVWGAAAADGALRHARNFDFPGIGVWDAAPAVVVCHPTGGQRYAFITTRGGDTPVVTVWNEAGLTFTSHTRFHREVGFDGATVVDLVHGLAMQAETLADVERLLRARASASTWGLAVSSWREGTARSFELHRGGVGVVAPRPGEDHLIVANRYRDPAMAAGEVTATPAWALHSDRRELRLAALIAQERPDVLVGYDWHGHYGHPNFLDFNLSGTFGLGQQWIDADSTGRHESPIETIDEYDATFREFDRVVGLKWLRCFHVNDSVKPLGSRVDRHAGIRRGLLDSPVRVATRGGELSIAWAGQANGQYAPVLMTGPATTVFSAEIELPNHL